MSSSSPLEKARRLLGSYLARQGLAAGDLAARLGQPVSAVEARLTGEAALDLDWLDLALSALEVPPLDFFGRLYAREETPQAASADTGGEPSAAPISPAPSSKALPDSKPDSDPDPEEMFTREEVEALVAEVRSLIRGATRMIEARELAREEAGTEEGDESA